MSREHSFSRLIGCSHLQLAVVAFAICLGTNASAQSGAPVVYPAKGQTQEQQNKDKYECNQWAVNQTGFNPANPPQATSGNPQQGQAVRGAARGAAAGAIGGAIAGDAGTGAAAGAAIGGGVGAVRRRRAKKEGQQQQAQAQAAGQDAYNRAFAACLQGRGYTVN
jgi:hypothetical protein